MKVSVIMPAYNAASTIAESIGSVIRQTSADWELVIVDDGSADTTAAITSTFIEQDPRIRMVRQPNMGESAARNTGIGEARYEWLSFLDADDWIAPSYLERMTSELISRPEIAAVHCGSVRVALDGTEVSDDYLPPAGDLFPTLALRAAFPVNACLVRKSLVEAVGKFDTSLKKSADWDLWQRVARTGAQFHAVRQVLAYYRMAPNSASLEAEQLLVDGLTVLRRGCTADPRVPNPYPPYANGWQEGSVQQQYYLLCWCAGLLLGRGQDATHLLDLVTNDRLQDLYPDAIARCLFEAATLPSCQPRSAWEKLWPEIHLVVETFVDALARKTRVNDLASRSLIELKKLVLKHSPTWEPVAAELERAGLLRESVQEIEAILQEKARLERELGMWQGIAEERALLIANFNEQRWARFGSRLGLLKQPDIGSVDLGAEGAICAETSFARETESNKWELRVCGSSQAELAVPPHNADTIRVAIARVVRPTPWHIQLNLPRQRVTAHRRYTVQFVARADRRRHIGVGMAKAHEPWTGLGLYKTVKLTKEWQTFQEQFTCTESDNNARIHFDLGGCQISVEFSRVTLRSHVDPDLTVGADAANDAGAGERYAGRHVKA